MTLHFTGNFMGITESASSREELAPRRISFQIIMASFDTVAIGEVKLSQNEIWLN